VRATRLRDAAACLASRLDTASSCFGTAVRRSISAAVFKLYWTAKPRQRGELKPRVVILSSGYHQTVRHAEKGTVSEEALDARPR